MVPGVLDSVMDPGPECVVAGNGVIAGTLTRMAQARAGMTEGPRTSGGPGGSLSGESNQPSSTARTSSMERADSSRATFSLSRNTWAIV